MLLVYGVFLKLFVLSLLSVATTNNAAFLPNALTYNIDYKSSFTTLLEHLLWRGEMRV